MAAPVTPTDKLGAAFEEGNPLWVTVAAGGAGTAVSVTNWPTAFGAPSDVAWTGIGDASIISLLKAIAINTSTT